VFMLTVFQLELELIEFWKLIIIRIG